MKYAEFFSVLLASTIKFVGGPIAGFALGLTFWETVFCSLAGMMATVVLLLFAQDFMVALFKRFRLKKGRTFTKTTRFAIKVKSKFGLSGIAFLTPFLFTPIGGTLLALTFKFPKYKIFIFMLLSGFIGGIIQTAFFYQLPAIKTWLGW